MKKLAFLLILIFIFILGSTVLAIAEVEQAGFYLQVGAYSELENLQEEADFLQAQNLPIRVEGDDQLRRIYVGPYATEKEAQAKLKELANYGVDGFIKELAISSGLASDDFTYVLKSQIITNHHLHITGDYLIGDPYVQNSRVDYKFHVHNPTSSEVEQLVVTYHLPTELSSADFSVERGEHPALMPLVEQNQAVWGANNPISIAPGDSLELEGHFSLTNDIYTPLKLYDKALFSWQQDRNQKIVLDLTNPQYIGGWELELKIEFDVDQARIRSGYLPYLALFSDYLKQFPTADISLEGSTDSNGSSEYNTTLARRRIESVRKHLINEYGIESYRLQNIFNYGETRPIANNQTEIGRQRNRSVIIRANLSGFRKNSAVDVKNYIFQNDLINQGVYGSHKYYFYVEDYWSLKEGNYLELILSQGFAEPVQNSSLTVYLNEIPIKTISLLDQGSQSRLFIPLPQEEIKKGFNLISLHTYHRLSDRPCEDDLNTGNWVRIHRGSYVHLEYSESVDEEGLINYPYPYLKASHDQPVHSLFLISPNSSSSVIESCLLLAADMGRLAKVRPLDFHLFQTTEWEEQKNKISFDSEERMRLHQIFIGRPDELPIDLKEVLLSEEIHLSKEKGIIKEAVLPDQSEQKILLVVSENEQALVKASQALTTKNILHQMLSNTQLISSDLKIPRPEKEMLDRITLKDLNYSGTMLEGLFKQEVIYSVKIPSNRHLREGATVNLEFRYSKVLDFDKSLVTVFLNNLPIGSKALDSSRADGDRLELEIPAELLTNTYFDLKISFNLLLHSTYCETRNESSAWAFVSNNSFFNFPQAERETEYLENYPAPLIRDDEFNDLIILVSDHPTSDELENLAGIMAYLAQDLKNLSNVRVMKANDFTGTEVCNTLLVLGLPKNHSVLQELNEKLYIQFSPDFSRLISNDKATILEEYGKNLATIQLIEEPYPGIKKGLVVTGTSKEALNWASEMLQEVTGTEKLYGNAVLIDQKGQIQRMYFGQDQKQGQSKNSTWKNPVNKLSQLMEKNDQVKTFVIFTVTILLLILISAIFIIRRNK